MKVGDLLTGQVVSCEPSVSVAEAARTMAKNKVGSIVVLEGDRLAGILTERDLLRAIANGTQLEETPVSNLMTAEVVTATPEWQVYEAATEMLARGFRHLVVCEGERVVGVISTRDVLLAGKRIELSSGNWAVLRDPLTFTARERKALHRYLMRLRDGNPREPNVDELIGLLVGEWSYEEEANGDVSELLRSLPPEDYHALRSAVMREIPKLQRAVHPAPGWRKRVGDLESRSTGRGGEDAGSNGTRAGRREVPSS